MSVAWLDGALTTMALCWRLDRADGVSIGFTAHDRDLTIGGVVYRASPGMVPSAIRQSDGFDVDTLDVEGALTHDAITADDLTTGRWDGAALTLFATDWTDPAETLIIARGEIGDVSIRDAAFTAELRGPTALLERPVVEQTSPDCRAQLGDRRCRVDLAARTRFARIVSVAEEVLTLDTVEPSANAYAYGRLRWLDRDNAGLSAALLSSAGSTVTLRDPAPFAIAPGTLVELLEGCDRLLATCRTRFANAANFRGEPYLPGIDLLTRYGTD
ncbi:DUF2163 domain-containing protein [Sphingomonas sp. CGMCC 1.13654]|uniref:DUF2163 domain-containing protein n=1 Tax=Sphingomonas chungangi TaxID=2683589 RepID=A0A838L3L9_9SPHN|nr:DUF2163 domain-containing protein [Sphingomonas chungangi]MBA2932989.1 DUF2163 domain-containing protein [Sphingomonas chungangi]MVW56609.1 DUF2163 domain-containing protein [Sphingomonas chungangi]